MPYWNKLFMGGQDYPLDHLEPFVFSAAPVGQQELVEINVKFNNHCFSRDHTSQKDTLLPVGFFSSSEKRVFDPIRYEMSKNLPSIIKSLPGRRVKSTRYAEFVVIDLKDGIRYAVFFNLKRTSKREATLFVMSAYPIYDDRKNIAVTGEMRFAYLLSSLMKKEKPKFPPKA